MKLIGIITLTLILTSCTQMTTRTGDCTTAGGEVTWVFYNEMPINRLHTKCIFCGAGVAEGDLYDFVHEQYDSMPHLSGMREGLEQDYANAQESGDDINESLTPCFYTTDYGGHPVDTQTGCEQECCSDFPSISSMVRRDQGAWSVVRSIINMHYD
jgi:hypothetical protein